MAISLTIWIVYIVKLYKALNGVEIELKDGTKERKRDPVGVQNILYILKILLIVFVLIMSFVMTNTSWYDTI